MTRKMFLDNEFSDNVIYVCSDHDLVFQMTRFFTFVQMTAEEMSAESLIADLPRLRSKKISMIMLEGQENIKKILNRSYELKKFHPDLQFILLLDEPNEILNAQEHFSYVRFLKKSEVIERISLLMEYISSRTEPEQVHHVNLYKPSPAEHHIIDRYL